MTCNNHWIENRGSLTDTRTTCILLMSPSKDYIVSRLNRDYNNWIDESNKCWRSIDKENYRLLLYQLQIINSNTFPTNSLTQLQTAVVGRTVDDIGHQTASNNYKQGLWGRTWNGYSSQTAKRPKRLIIRQSQTVSNNYKHGLWGELGRRLAASTKQPPAVLVNTRHSLSMVEYPCCWHVGSTNHTQRTADW